jgi:hypothetical protein
MSENALKMTQKLSSKDHFEVTENDVAVTEDEQVLAATEGREIRVESHVWAFTVDAEQAVPAETFTREVFEDALDKVSRPLKGRFAHVPYSTDDLIRDKRTDVELEDR